MPMKGITRKTRRKKNGADFDGERIPSDKVIRYMEEAADLALEQEKVRKEDMEVSVSFVDMEEIRELNRIYRDKDEITDVLSFSMRTLHKSHRRGRCPLGMWYCVRSRLFSRQTTSAIHRKENWFTCLPTVFFIFWGMTIWRMTQRSGCEKLKKRSWKRLDCESR